MVAILPPDPDVEAVLGPRLRDVHGAVEIEIANDGEGNCSLLVGSVEVMDLGYNPGDRAFFALDVANAVVERMLDLGLPKRCVE